MTPGESTREGRSYGRAAIAATIAFACAALLWGFSVWVDDPAGPVVTTDLRILARTSGVGQPLLRRGLIGLTEAGRTASMIAIVTVLAVGAIAARATRAGLLIIAISASSSVGVSLLKEAVGRSRPAVGALVEHTNSWPSGHASAGLALALAVAFALWTLNVRWLVPAVVVTSVGLLVGLSRVYLNIHWGSDVLGGWILALGVTSTFVALDSLMSHERYAPRPIDRNVMAMTAFIAITIFVSAMLIGSSTDVPALDSVLSAPGEVEDLSAWRMTGLGPA